MKNEIYYSIKNNDKTIHTSHGTFSELMTTSYFIIKKIVKLLNNDDKNDLKIFDSFEKINFDVETLTYYSDGDIVYIIIYFNNKYVVFNSPFKIVYKEDQYCITILSNIIVLSGTINKKTFFFNMRDNEAMILSFLEKTFNDTTYFNNFDFYQNEYLNLNNQFINIQDNFKYFNIILHSLLQHSFNYIRFDDDKKNHLDAQKKGNGYAHPRYHLDVFFNNNSLKLGIGNFDKNKISIEDFIEYVIHKRKIWYLTQQ